MPTSQISKADESNQPESVILRALEGDPTRHKPLINHPPSSSSTPANYEPIPAAMYTLETRYRPIPQRVLPQHTEPRVYYLQREEPPTPPLPIEESDKIVPTEVKDAQTVFLEPKVTSQPILYSIVGAKTIPTVNEQPTSIDENIVAKKKTPEAVDRTPVFYTLVSNPRFQVRIEEPVKEIPEPRQSTIVPQTTTNTAQLVPVLYSIVGGPSHVPQVIEMPTSSQPKTQSENGETNEPRPILYTIVGDSQAPNNIGKDSRQPLAPIKQQNGNPNTALFAVIGDPTKPKSMALSPNSKQTSVKQEQQSTNQTQPSFYTIVGQHNSYPDENQLQPATQKKSPARRVGRSLDRQSAPEPDSEPINRTQKTKHKVLPKIKDSNTRAETVFFPVPENEHTPRKKYVYNPPWKITPEQPANKNFQIPRYDALQLPDYISPYAYHPARPYREETVHPASLPIITTSRNSKQTSQESDHSPNRKRRNDQRTFHSLERYNQKSKPRVRLWDYEYNTQTDIDDEDTNGMTSDGSRRNYRRFRPRTPWIPVW